MGFKIPTPGSTKAAPARTSSAAAASAAGRPVPRKKFSMKLGEYDSLNNGAFRDLPEGRFVYKVTSLSAESVKSDPTGKKYKISLGLNRYTPDGSDDKYTHNFNVCGDSETAREIAFKGLQALADAVGIESETFDEDQFPAVVGNDVLLEVKASTKVDPTTRKAVTRLNLNRIEAPKPDDYAYLYPDGVLPQEDGEQQEEGDGGEQQEEVQEEAQEEAAGEEQQEEGQEGEQQEESGAEEAQEEAAEEAQPEPPAKPASSKAVASNTKPAAGGKPTGKGMPWDKKK